MRVRFGSNENQRLHTFRYVLDAGLDPLVVEEVIRRDLVRVPLLDGLNKGKLDFRGSILRYHAFRFSDGDVNVGRITIDASKPGSSASER